MDEADAEALRRVIPRFLSDAKAEVYALSAAGLTVYKRDAFGIVQSRPLTPKPLRVIGATR